MLSSFSPFPNWHTASQFEIFVWIVAMSLAALFGIWFLITFTQDAANGAGQEFRSTFLFFAGIVLMSVGLVVATRGNNTANARSQQLQPGQCPPAVADYERTRTAP